MKIVVDTGTLTSKCANIREYLYDYNDQISNFKENTESMKNCWSNGTEYAKRLEGFMSNLNTLGDQILQLCVSVENYAKDHEDLDNRTESIRLS